MSQQSAIILGQRFKTQLEFEEAWKRYEKEQKVPFNIVNSVTRKRFNEKLCHDDKDKVPPEFKWKEATVACVHYGKPRQHQHVEGTAKRVNQSTIKRDCLAKFNLNFSSAEQCYIVTKLEKTHRNHQLKDASLSGHYSKFRRPPEKVVTEANKLFDYDVKAHKIKGMVASHGIVALTQDIQNLRNNWKANSKGSDSPVEALLKQLQDLKDEDPNSIVALNYEPESYLLQTVFFQTSEMRAALETYPEVIIMDTTYKLSDNDMPLVVFEVIDCFGAGRIAGYALILSEKKEIVTSAVELLKLGCPSLTEKVQVVMIDKDQSEIAAIREILPNAQVHLCVYHVEKAMERSGVKKLTDKWEDVKPRVMKMVHAFSEEDYNKAYLEFQDFVGKDSEFMKYFNKHWHHSDLVWVEYQRNKAFTLGERTTGRVESHNADIKKMISKRQSVDMVILNLRTLNKNSSVQNDHKIFQQQVKTKYHKYSKDPIIQTIMRKNTPFVADLMKRQYERSLDPPSENYHEVTREKCDCAFFIRFKLVCAHIFRHRRLEGLEIYDHELVPKRWTLNLDDKSNGELSIVEIMAAPIKAPKQKKAMSCEDRFNMADAICKRICSLIANCGGAQFEGRILALSNMEEIYQMGKEVAVVGVDGEGRADIPVYDPSQGGKIKQDSEEIPIKDDETTRAESHEENDEENSTMTVTSLENLKSLLKLKPKPIIRGRPKGKRDVGKRIRPKCIEDAELSADEDDVDSVNPSECSFCKGPVTHRTSYTKQNYGRKYVLCASRFKNEACKAFHRWIETEKSGTIKAPDLKSDSPKNPTEKHPSDETDKSVTDENETDENETDEKETDEKETDENENINGKNETAHKTQDTDFDYLLDVDDDLLSSLFDRNDTQEDQSKLASTPSDLGTVIDGMEDFLQKLERDDNKEAITPEKKYFCFTCKNSNIQKKKISTPGPLFGREYYACFSPTCPRPKPFLFWAPTTPQKETQDIRTFFSGRDGNNSGEGEKLCQQPGKGKTEVFPTGAPTASSSVQSMSKLCCSCAMAGTIVVLCQKCGKSVHPIMPCSVPAPNADGSVKLIDKKRICRDCNGSSCPAGVTVRKKRNIGADSCEMNVKKFEFGFNIESYLVLDYKITMIDVNSLKPGNWLNDKIIDCFLDLTSRPEKLSQTQARIFKPYSLALECTSMGSDLLFNMAETKYLLFNDLWLVPTHVNRNHWVLFVVIVKKKIILLLDPIKSLFKYKFSKDVLQQLQILRLMIGKSHIQCRGEPVNWKEWKICVPQDLSTQNNGSDCGVYVCLWVHSICAAVEVPAEISRQSQHIRAWILNEILSNGTAQPISKPSDKNDDDDNVEFIDTEYLKFDELVANGTHKFPKPWEELPPPHIDECPPDMVSAGDLLPSILDNLWKATEKECGALICKKVLEDMYYCEFCQEYYHRKCVRDYGELPDPNDFYLCPQHKRPKSKDDGKMQSVGKRNVAPPLRLRKSLS